MRLAGWIVWKFQLGSSQQDLGDGPSSCANLVKRIFLKHFQLNILFYEVLQLNDLRYLKHIGYFLAFKQQGHKHVCLSVCSFIILKPMILIANFLFYHYFYRVQGVHRCCLFTSCIVGVICVHVTNNNIYLYRNIFFYSFPIKKQKI